MQILKYLKYIQWMCEWVTGWMNESINQQTNKRTKWTNEGVTLLKKLTLLRWYTKYVLFMEPAVLCKYVMFTQSHAMGPYIEPVKCHCHRCWPAIVWIHAILSFFFQFVTVMALFCAYLVINLLRHLVVLVISLWLKAERYSWIFMLHLMHLDFTMVRLINFFEMSNSFHC